MALGFGIAGLAHDNVRVWMKTWESQRHVGDARQWDLAYSRLILAHRLNPLNADYSADLGRLMEWRAWRQLPTSAKNVRDRANAEYFYAHAINARPGWGYAWVNYAENRLLQGYPDGDFLRALEIAIVYAPWEPWVQKKVAWMGMATWDELPEHMRPMVRESIRRTVALENSLNEIVRLAIQYNWLDHLKPMLQTDRQLEALRFVHEQIKAQW